MLKKNMRKRLLAGALATIMDGADHVPDLGAGRR